MKNRTLTFRKLGLFLAVAGLLVTFASLNILGVSARAAADATATPEPTTAPAQTGSSPHTSGDCLACHGQEKMIGKLPNGDLLSLTIVPMTHEGSFHNQPGAGCTFCHLDQQQYPHKGSTPQACTVCHWQMSGTAPVDGKLVFDLPYEDARAVALSINNVCQKCHKEKFEEVKNSGHTRILNEGNRYAPVCVDCHSAHDITAVDRIRIAQICSKCHLAEYSAYKSSVHGSALEKEGNPDVPTCVDCHGGHKITGPRESNFRGDVAVELCGKCHADKTLMSKYGLSTDVLSTYMDDVHGQTDLLGRLDNASITKATCYDCHGIHNILSPKNPYSKVYPENLQKTCQQCHKDASITFPQAWLSHKTPSLSAMPGLYFANVASLGVVIVVVAVIVLFIILDVRRRMLAKVIVHVKPEE